MRHGHVMPPIILMILVSACSSLKGKDGNDGRDGRDGQNGSSCRMLPHDGGLAIQCGAEKPMLLTGPVSGANGTDGIDGKNGKDGKDGASCVLLEKTEQSARIGCPAQDGSGAMVEVTIKNGDNGKDGKDGKDGTSCTYVSEQVSFHVIRCGNKEFEVRNGRNGTNGTNGRNGVDGQDGQDGQANFSSALLDAAIVDEVRVDSRLIRCSSRYQTNDEAFRSRIKSTGIYVNDKLLGTASTGKVRDYQTEAQYHEGVMTLSFPIFRDSLQPGDRISCRNSVFAEFYSTLPAVALTSASNSSERIVLDSPGRLQKATELELTGAVAAYRTSDNTARITTLLLNNKLEQPADDSQCKGVMFVNNWPEAGMQVNFKVHKGANEIPVKSSAYNAVTDIRLYLDCEGDKSYITHRWRPSDDLEKYAFSSSLTNEQIQRVPMSE